MNDPTGSQWRKWDLHVHTPASIVNNYGGDTEQAWTKYLADLESLPAEFGVLGINDYIFIDGYRRLKKEKEAGRLKNIHLLLPVIEFRLNRFGGTDSDLSRVNFHVIFSDEIDPDIIETQFLNALPRDYKVCPEYAELAQQRGWKALPTKQSLEDLGRIIAESIPEEKRSSLPSARMIGFNNLCFDLEKILEVLDGSYFKDKYITVVGKAEWADMKWSGQHIAEKKSIINRANLVFMSASSVEHWKRSKEKLRAERVNDMLLDCSDAHALSTSSEKDKLGKCLTWIKADPTFAGLKQVLNDHAQRTCIDETPAKIRHVHENPTKYISSIAIRRKAEAGLSELWFDNAIDFNTSLIAVIGNKGSGKSALTDILGLLGNTRQSSEFSFLRNFQKGKENKAKHFIASITWRDGDTQTAALDSTTDPKLPERIKYIPQNYLEKICNEIGKTDESEFDRELKKVIFSHVAENDRLGCVTFDEMIDQKTAETKNQLAILREDLSRLNEEIIGLEAKTRADYKDNLTALLAAKTRELDAHQKNEPPKIEKPPVIPGPSPEDAIISEIQTVTADIAALVIAMDKAQAEQGLLARKLAVIGQLGKRMTNLEMSLERFKQDSLGDLELLEMKEGDLFTYSIHRTALNTKETGIKNEKSKVDTQLDPSSASSLVFQKRAKENQRSALQARLDEPARRFEEYRNAVAEWERKKAQIIGDKESAGSLEALKAHLEELANISPKLDNASGRRMKKVREVYDVIMSLAEAYRDLYKPVHSFIESKAIAKQKFQLNFKVDILNTGFAADFLAFISQAASGSFYGKEEGTAALEKILKSHSFETFEDAELFLMEILSALTTHPHSGEGLLIENQLRKGKTLKELYDFLFSLDYLSPRYALRMGEKELSELSPGERGTLLLVFYLLVDKEEIPLVIDQPEENLDNQTVYELLVPCIADAKQRRQVFIVTHNPNLAVVCDAEQIVCARLQKKDNYRMTYPSGAIESRDINRAIVDVLEGTMPAFNNRESKYFTS